MHRGQRADGEDAFAEPIASDWDVRLVIAATTAGPQGDAVDRRHATHGGNLAVLRSVGDAVRARSGDGARGDRGRDLEALGAVTEASCLAMHASAMAARPAVVYFIGATIDGYRTIQELRRSGVPAWFTCDAGPHVKALTDAAHAAAVEAALAPLGKTWICRPGPRAEVVE